MNQSSGERQMPFHATRCAHAGMGRCSCPHGNSESLQASPPDMSRFPRRGRSLRRRLGFSLPEMLIVLVIAGVMMRLALPKIAAMKDKNTVRAAKQQVLSYLTNARAAAIRQSRSAQFYVNNH